jgi:hypothetical protein
LIYQFSIKHGLPIKQVVGETGLKLTVVNLTGGDKLSIDRILLCGICFAIANICCVLQCTVYKNKKL